MIVDDKSADTISVAVTTSESDPPRWADEMVRLLQEASNSSSQVTRCQYFPGQPCWFSVPVSSVRQETVARIVALFERLGVQYEIRTERESAILEMLLLQQKMNALREVLVRTLEDGPRGIKQ